MSIYWGFSNAGAMNMHTIIKRGDILYHEEGIRRQASNKCSKYQQFCYVTRNQLDAYALTMQLENDFSRMKDLLRVDVCLDIRNDETVYFIIFDFNKRRIYG